MTRSFAPPSAARSPWTWALLGALLGALLTLALFAPAQWLANAIAQASADQVQLAQARGTLWNGSAQLVLTGGGASQDRAALPGRIVWQLRPTWSGLRAQLHAACCTDSALQLQVKLRWGGAQLTLADSQSQWPAAVLAGLGTPWNTLQPQGQLQLRTTHLQADWAAGRMVLSGQAQLDALAMSSRLSTVAPMGSYRFELQGGEVPTLTLQTLEGSLQLSGSGQWVGQRLRFAGEASAAPERQAALANLLNLIGRRSGARSLITLG
ncbi:MAG: type II secretion system protein N [Giesbergeria sp.]|nr:type II secretion system protein N [Giesbergeria sp.]MBP6321362.1 type II secretion system protein N [Giesbergeria sp.]MBP6374814.1 type II secretion system protein N [Giesbergeria sp.]MBP7916253.1 type II secretion system protein N [Giesbergeria sp.]MBP8028519.1 type II secretion system protein N [Giesbergeria sp.]